MEFVKTKHAFDIATRVAAFAALHTPAFREIEKSIQDAQIEITRFGKAVERLSTHEGLYGYIHEMSKNEKKDLDFHIQTLHSLEAKSRELENALTQARDMLNKNRGRLTTAERNTQRKIIQLEQEILLKPFEDLYRNMKMKHENVAIQIQTIQAIMKVVKAQIKDGTEFTKQAVEMLKRELPRVTKIYVKASTNVFVNNTPLIFEITAVWGGKTSVYRVEWVPASEPFNLYKEIARILVTST